MFTTLCLIGMFFQQDTSVHQLKEIAVKANKPVIQQKAGMVIYDVQADAENKSSNVLHLMRKIPYLSLDADDNLLLKGSSDFKVLINGKPAANWKDLPASTIVRIEVYTIPPARFDAEGAGGVINIVTVPKLEDEYRGNLNISGKGPAGGPGAGGAFTWKQHKIGFSTFMGGSFSWNPATVTSITGNVLNQDTKETSHGRTGYVGVEMSDDFDSLHLVTTRFNTNGSRVLGDKWISGIGHTHARNLNNALDAALDYQWRGRVNKNRILTFSYRYGHNKGELYNGNANETGTNENTVQVDYVYPLTKLTIEAGVKSIFRNSRSDDFVYDQTVLAAYNAYQYNMDSWNLQGGLRWERTITANKSYNNFFPNISLNKTFKNQHQFNIGCSQRMKRPGINRLNPFVDRQNPYFVFTGNPDLMPVVVNSLSAGYNIGGRMAGLDYTWLHHADMPVSTYDSITMVTTSTFANAGNIAGLSAFIYAGFKITDRCNVNTNGNIIYFRIGTGELLTYALNIAGVYNFNKGWKGRADGTLLSKNPTGLQGTVNGMVATAFAISKDIGNISLNAGVSNPFTKYRQRIAHTTGNNFYQVSNTQQYFRAFNLTMNYSFGKMTGNINKSKTTIKNIDLSNGKGM